ncbi:MAG: NFACT RNA binding domain-containing protein [Erysipelotrichaceae bacterium]
MAIDGLLLSKIVDEFQSNVPFKIHKISHLSSAELLFQCRSNTEKFNILISCHSVYNRLQISQFTQTTNAEPTAFVMLLRKYIEDGLVASLTQAGLDRVVQISIQKRNALGDMIHFKLMIELMGKYANVILVDADNKIIDAMKRIPPFENNKRTIYPTAEYIPVENIDKLDPFVSVDYNSHQTLYEQFHGFSPLLAREFEYRLKKISFKDIMTEIKASKTLYIYPNQEAHCIQLTHLELPFVQYPLMEGLDQLYHHREENERIKQHTDDLSKFINKESKKDQQKLIKLQQSLDDANQLEQFRLYGDLLLAYAQNKPKGAAWIEVEDYTTDTIIRIPLDEKLDGKQNTKKYFQKYTKSKKGQIQIQNQIDLTKQEIEYFDLLKLQIDQASLSDALEIKEELTSQGYLKTQISHKKKQKAAAPIHLVLDDETHIYIGKNNLQNELITFKIAYKSDTWLHVKDFHGAHVLIHHPNPSNTSLRIAAQCAAYYSAARTSSSVPVNYCLISQVKKIPGMKPGLVSLNRYQTIFVDPIEKEILQLIKDHAL